MNARTCGTERGPKVFIANGLRPHDNLNERGGRGDDTRLSG